jgi:hypothetical protein
MYSRTRPSWFFNNLADRRLLPIPRKPASFRRVLVTPWSLLFGEEALVSYDGQDAPGFYVFDWAREPNARWQRSIPSSQLTEYLKKQEAHGAIFAVLPLMNMTYMNPSGSWVNQVWLLNQTTSHWDLVYQYTYPASLAQQLTGWPGSWGPILETFQDRYTGTNDMGALNTQLSSQSNGQWGAWSPLGQADSQLRVDDKGFLPDFLDPNTSWVVHS